MKKLLTAAIAGVTLAAGIGAAEIAQAQPGYYYRDHNGRGWNNGRYWNDRRYYRNRDDGALAALAAGALIGSVVAGDRGYYGGGYYDRGYYGRPYRVRCFNQRVWDPYWGGYAIRRVCR